MKKNPIFLVMLALLLAFSFSVIGCEEDSDSGSGGGGGKGFPADLTPDAGSGIMKSGGSWGDFDTLGLFFTNYTDDTAKVEAVNADDDYYGVFWLKSISGKAITVTSDDDDSDVVFCTDYSIADKKLKITGGAGVFAAFNGKELAFEE